jgi:hypothetical protein
VPHKRKFKFFKRVKELKLSTIWYTEKAMFGLTAEERICFLKYFPPGMKNFLKSEHTLEKPLIPREEYLLLRTASMKVFLTRPGEKRKASPTRTTVATVQEVSRRRPVAG